MTGSRARVVTVTLGYVRVTRQRDGKNVSISMMLDRLEMLEQLGLIPNEHGVR